MTKQNKRTFKAPAHLTQHRAGARAEECTATRRPLVNGAGATPRGRYLPTGGTACSERPYTRSAIGAHLVSFVVRRRRQWSVVHQNGPNGRFCDTTNGRPNSRSLLVVVRCDMRRSARGSLHQSHSQRPQTNPKHPQATCRRSCFALFCALVAPRQPSSTRAHARARLCRGGEGGGI